MTPTNLPDLYSRVVAKRPELAVKNLRTSTNVWTEDHPPITVWIYGWTPKTSDAILDDYAYGLILAKWVEALPEGMCLARVRMTHSGEAWIVAQDMNDDTSAFIGPNPIEALAAFWVECEG